MSLYQSGISQDVLLNFTQLGRTSHVDRNVVIPFPQPLNFRDAIIQIITGTARLVSHCVTGLVSLDIVYSNSGKDLTLTAEQKAKATVAKKRRLEKRTTGGVAQPARGKWDAGLTLRERLQVMNYELNKKYSGTGDDAVGKLSNWPATICTTTDGYIRSKWSCFAIIAVTNKDFFHHLGYNDAQINTFNWEGTDFFSLGSLSFEAGSADSLSPADMDATTDDDAQFLLIPRNTDIPLHFESYVEDAPATPHSMKAVLDTLISSANYKYRASVLEQLWAEQLVWPEGGTYDWALYESGHAVPIIVPFNIFPMMPNYDQYKVTLDLNTQRGIGSIKEMNCIDRNIFGFPTHTRAWNERGNSLLRIQAQTEDHRGLGIPGQYCQITCNDLFFSRTSITEHGTSPPICALFLTPNPLHSYFPKNRLSSSITYGKLAFDVRSRYNHPSMIVTNEIYDYSLVIEIRNVY